MYSYKTHQVKSDAASKQEAQVNIYSVVLVLNDASQTTDDGTNNKEEHQQRFQQFRWIRQRAVEVHLPQKRHSDHRAWH